MRRLASWYSTRGHNKNENGGAAVSNDVVAISRCRTQYKFYANTARRVRAQRSTIHRAQPKIYTMRSGGVDGTGAGRRRIVSLKTRATAKTESFCTKWKGVPSRTGVRQARAVTEK